VKASLQPARDVVKIETRTSVYAVPGDRNELWWAAVFVVPREKSDYFALDLDELPVEQVVPIFGIKYAFFMLTIELEPDEFMEKSRALLVKCREIRRDSLSFPCELFSPARFSIHYPKLAKKFFGSWKRVRFQVVRFLKPKSSGG
jgi:hypothetical protein